MRVLNKHTAAIDGIATGQEGDVDGDNPGVRAHLAAGLLVALELDVGVLEVSGVQALDVPEALQAAEANMRAMREHIDRMETELRAQRDREGELAAALEAANAKVASLEADLATATAPAKKPTKPAKPDTEA